MITTGAECGLTIEPGTVQSLYRMPCWPCDTEAMGTIHKIAASVDGIRP